MAYISDSPMFKSLCDEEEEHFKESARLEFPPCAPSELKEKWNLYHPVCREEWMRLGIYPKA